MEGRKKMKMMLMPSLSRREMVRAADGSGRGGSGVGCMSGIFHFLSRHHHSHSRKRLSSAGRRKKPVLISPPKEMPPPPPENRAATLPQKCDESTILQLTAAIIPNKTFCLKEGRRRRSCEVQRSPTLPSEIRRSSSTDLSLDSPRRPSPLVVRLMGLDEIPVGSPDPAVEKRRKLLGALEKCDEDLKSLKRIIDAARTADKRRKTVEAVVGLDLKRDNVEDGDSSMESAVKSVDSPNGEQPSPVSVLQPISSPTYRSERSKTAYNGESDDEKQPEIKQGRPSILHQINIERLPQVAEGGRRWRRWEGRRSHALVASVDRVWADGVGEQRREVGRVAVGLERGIFGDLVDELVKELTGCYFKGLISRGACRKRLCF